MIAQSNPERINLAEVREAAEDGWSLDPPTVLALIDAVEAARGVWATNASHTDLAGRMDELARALARFDFGDKP